MKIYSMTATFGKLHHQTLTLEPGLNILQAPNEWGKSTWCAFLVAMLYGINTREQTKTGFLADKEHYAPWDGTPMSGRMDLCWNGRDITIERRNKGRGFFNDFKAYETASGLAVEELTAANCGQTLLGVEQSVFVRAGFLSELPVTEDEALRRRLNALVTTADESGTSDVLEQKLKDLKNRIRFNKKGLLPEAEAEKNVLEQKLQQLQVLEHQQETITQNQQALAQQRQALENHLTALAYAQSRGFAEQMASARTARDVAREALEQAQQACAGLPDAQTLRRELEQLQKLREEREMLLMQAQMLPPIPAVPEAQDAFRGKDPQRAQTDAALDAKTYAQLITDRKRPLSTVMGAVAAALGLVLALFLPGIPGKVGALLILGLGIAALCAGIRKQQRLDRQIGDLQAAYRGIPEGQWEQAACAYATQQQEYTDALHERQKTLEHMHRAMEENALKLQKLTKDIPQSRYEQERTQMQRQWEQLAERQRQYAQAEQFFRSFPTERAEVPKPTMPDTLTDNREQTQQKLQQIQLQQQLLHQKLGQCQGQMETLGNRQTLLKKLEQAKDRIARLELAAEAVGCAIRVQQTAAQELQRRFAPRISQRAQCIMSTLTNGRYDRLMLDRQLQLSAAAQGEDTLRSNLWRSAGTADQLYFALRLAVAEELTPEAPLVLDDALVRFDDERLGAALELLNAQDRQVLLFTCQSREKRWQENL